MPPTPAGSPFGPGCDETSAERRGREEMLVAPRMHDRGAIAPILPRMTTAGVDKVGENIERTAPRER